MLIYLLRHGLTGVQRPKALSRPAGHPALARGLAQLRRADIDPKVVYISTLQRTAQTAKVLFPEAKLVPVDGLKEMCFGSFEGAIILRWSTILTIRRGSPPTAKAPAPTVSARMISRTAYVTFAALVDKALADGEDMLVILAHGGTRWPRWSATACRAAAITGGAAPTRAAMC